MGNAEDGQLDLEAPDRIEVQAGEDEQRNDQYADDVGHELVAEERPFSPRWVSRLIVKRRTTTRSRVRQVFGPWAARSASRAL